MEDRTPKMPQPTPDPHTGEPLPPAPEGMRPGADPAVVRPEEDEQLGPLEGLVSAAAADVKTEAGVGDVSEAEAELEALGVEEEGIASGQILGIVAAILVSVAALVIVLYFLFYVPFRTQTQVSAAAGPEHIEVRQLRAEADARLVQFGLNEDSTFYIPIDRAMGIVAAEFGSEAALPTPETRQAFNAGAARLDTRTPARPATDLGRAPAPVPAEGPVEGQPPLGDTAAAPAAPAEAALD
ncbi:MAG: hypothetical protein ACK41D_00855 [Rubricoccaceae bacterium]